jgi:hypothetical protein
VPAFEIDLVYTGLSLSAAWSLVKQNRNQTSYDSYRVDGYQQAKVLKPSQAIGPPNVDLARQPSLASSLGVPKRHAGAVQGLVWTAVGLHHLRQMQGYLLDETQSVAH